MPVPRKSRQVLTYLREDEADELDEAVAEAEVSRAEYVRRCVLVDLEKRRESKLRVERAGDFVVVDAMTGDRIPGPWVTSLG